MKKIKFILLILIPLSIYNCSVQYGLTQPTSTKAKTYQVNYFQNNSALIEPGIERDFKIALENLILNQTSLALVATGGDVVYEGEITEYRISPTTSTAEITAAQNRLTISVNVRFYDKTDEDAELEQRFSFFYDYPANEQLIGNIKETAHTEIFDRLTQDILNATLAKW